ncbi:TerC/Alx family metal homeostasis membrane protein [Aridibaculum aurantiacum]|uniref:TerC/Alx family metal homeostasis membrane protein n=1 Tax=Aridibaculum aurantiacum TaxID=2810307 RepID=UPI001A96F921|nr:TerC/Alx family metal homeostasis membrane protein [Aridibaculum aurantiacum]
MTDNEITYLIFGIVLALSMILDLAFLTKANTTITLRKAFYQSIFWVAISLAFCGFVWYELGGIVGMKFLTAYLMEKSLSIDNIFVFILIFTFFKVKEADAARALFVGIILAIIFRVVFIYLGIELIERFHWLLYVFGFFLLYTGAKLFFKKDEEEFDPSKSLIYRWAGKIFRITNVEPNGRYVIKSKGKIFFTTLSLVVVMLAAIDIVFALDSIPTVVSLVREKANVPFSADDKLVIYSSNIFAVLGLRSLFFLLRGAVNKFDFLQQGIAIVLVFIGVKMLIEFFDIHISIYISLAVILVCLLGSILYSMQVKRKGTPKEVDDGTL